MTTTLAMSDNGHQFECVIESREASMHQLMRVTGLDEVVLQDAIFKGAVWLRRLRQNGIPRKPVRIRHLPDTLGRGDTVLLNYNPTILAATVPLPALISDQVNYSIWNKPAGVFSQASKWGDHCSMTRLVERLHNKPSHLVHRLDRAASGLIIIAHTRNALVRLAALFEQRQIAKFYRVTVEGRFTHALPHEIQILLSGKRARSKVLESTIRESEGLSDLYVQIVTGRKHQIRLHLSAEGFPVQGDRLYGVARDQQTELQLTASRLEFQCPFTAKLLNVEL